MPQFVTRISRPLRTAFADAERHAMPDDRATLSDAYRRRLAALRTAAPDTLRARVRRELRAAASLVATE